MVHVNDFPSPKLDELEERFPIIYKYFDIVTSIGGADSRSSIWNPSRRRWAAFGDLGKVVVRSVFVADRVRRINNATEPALGYWMGRLSIIRSTEVHIATLRRPLAWPYVAPIPEEKLYEIAHRLEEAGFRPKGFVRRWTGKSGRPEQDERDTVLGCG